MRWRCLFSDAEHHAKTPESRERMSGQIKRLNAERPELRKESSERMKRLNSDPEFRAKADAAAKLRRGKTWLGKRGGNGFLTKPQIALCIELGWPLEWMEHAVPTAAVKDQFESLPNSYKVDLAHPGVKLAIEVDGASHNTKKWRFLDARKTAVLNALGWRVLRFTNSEVLSDLQSITSKLRSITTTSLTEC